MNYSGSLCHTPTFMATSVASKTVGWANPTLLHQKKGRLGYLPREEKLLLRVCAVLIYLWIQDYIDRNDCNDDWHRPGDSPPDLLNPLSHRVRL